MGAPSPPEVVHAACSVGRVSVVHAPPLVAAEVEDGLSDPEPGLLQGRLKNSESLVNLHVLSHLSELQQPDLSSLIRSFPVLFGNTPTQTHLLIHDIDVGEAQPVRHSFYHVNPEKP